MMKFMMVAGSAALVLTGAADLRAQGQTPDASAAAEVRRQFLADFDTIRTRFVALAEAIPAEKYDWRPSPDVRTISQVLMHVANECYGFAPTAWRAEIHPMVRRVNGARPEFDENAPADKPTALRHLTQSCDYAKTAVDAVPIADIVGAHRIGSKDRTIIETSFMVTADLHEHLGQLIAYARSVGVTPPWSR